MTVTAQDTLLAQPVRDVMVAPVHTVRENSPLAQAAQAIDAFKISALPVVDVHGVMVGVISRTDLLRAGRVHVEGGTRKHTLSLPGARVQEFMHAMVEVVGPGVDLREAARRMVRQRLHRLYVAQDGYLRGVLSTRELIGAVADARVTMPISQIMSSGIVVVRASDPLSLAVDRMAASAHHGLVVVEEDWPVGMFTQVQALLARDAPPEQAVDEWMDPTIVCLPLATPAYRAAQQTRATLARTVLAVDANGLSGIVTGLDFAKLVK
jgi:CBS domain-containing protein